MSDDPNKVIFDDSLLESLLGPGKAAEKNEKPNPPKSPIPPAAAPARPLKPPALGQRPLSVARKVEVTPPKPAGPPPAAPTAPAERVRPAVPKVSPVPEASKPLVAAATMRERVVARKVEADVRPGTTASSAAALHRQAVERFTGEQWDAAAERFREVIRIDPRSWSAHFNLGLCLAKQDKHEAAADELAKAVKLDPERWESQEALGCCLLHCDRAEEALEAFDEAQGSTPDSGQALFGRGVALHLLGRLAEARESYQAALVDREDSCELLANLCILSSELEDHAEARAYAEQLQAADPDSERTLQVMAKAAQSEGENESAALFTAKLVDIAPTSQAVWFNLGVFCQRTERLDVACDAYRQAIEIDSSMVEAHTNLATVLQELDQLIAAKEHLAAALSHAPEHPGILWNIGLLSERLGDREEAEQCYRRVLAADPEWDGAQARLRQLQPARR